MSLSAIIGLKELRNSSFHHLVREEMSCQEATSARLMQSENNPKGGPEQEVATPKQLDATT